MFSIILDCLITSFNKLLSAIKLQSAFVTEHNTVPDSKTDIMDKRPPLNKSFFKKEKKVPSVNNRNYVVYTVHPFISKTLDFKRTSTKAKYILKPHIFWFTLL